MNDDQTISIIASQDDGIYFNHRTGAFVDLDENFKVTNIKEIIHDNEDRVFYMMCNKYMGKLGLFLIMFDEFNPTKHNFFFKLKNRLDIANANLFVVRNLEKKYKELIVSYKSIVVNTYTIMVLDISLEDPWTLFRHEAFQLWESKISGFFLNKNKDFVTINRDGVNVYTLGTKDKRQIKGNEVQEQMIHSLESFSYLKIDKTN